MYGPGIPPADERANESARREQIADVPEPRVKKVPQGYRAFSVACALIIGFVAGRSVAEGAGLIAPPAVQIPNYERERDGLWTFAAMVLVGLFVFATCRFLFLLGWRAAEVLRQAQTRPNTWVALGIIVCGTICMLAAVSLQWHAATSSASVTTMLPVFEMQGAPKGPSTTNAIGMSMQARMPLMVTITTIALLIAGGGITAIGIWASIPPASQALAVMRPTSPRGPKEGIVSQA
jgi:hypothetical protein